MRISDWSSDVCSSDLPDALTPDLGEAGEGQVAAVEARWHLPVHQLVVARGQAIASGRIAPDPVTPRLLDLAGLGLGVLGRDQVHDGDRKSTRLNSSH